MAFCCRSFKKGVYSCNFLFPQSGLLCFLLTSWNQSTLWEKRISVVEGGFAVVDGYRVQNLNFLSLGNVFDMALGELRSAISWAAPHYLGWWTAWHCEWGSMQGGWKVKRAIKQDRNANDNRKMTNFTNSKCKCCAWRQASAVSNKRGHAFLAGWLGFQTVYRSFKKPRNQRQRNVTKRNEA